MSQFGGTALSALAQVAEAQQSQAGTISNTQQLSQQAFAQRGQVSGQAAQTASQGLAAAGRTQQAGLRTLQGGINSVQGAFSQLFQAKFQRDMERERVDRTLRLETSRKKTAEANDSARIQGILQARIAQNQSESGIRASRIKQLETDLKGATNEDERAVITNLIDTFKSRNAFDLNDQEVLLEDFRLNDIDKLNDVPGARGKAHMLTGRFVVGSEASAQIDPRQAAAIQARGGYGIQKDNEAVERLRKHELTVSRHVQLGVITDMPSIAESLKKGTLTDVQVAQKLMTSPGIPQIARLSDIVQLAVGGDVTREDREELLDQFQTLADSGELDVSSIRGIIGGLDSLLELGSNSLVSAAGETDMDPEDRQQLLRVAFELRRSLASVEISKAGVSQGIKRDRVEVFRQAVLNGHSPSVETEVKIFKVLDNAQTLMPQVMEKLTTGTIPEKARAISLLTDFAGLGVGGEQAGDLLKGALDATVQTSGSVGVIVPPPRGPGRDLVQEGLTRVGIEGAGPEAGPGEIVARGAAGAVGETARLLSPGISELFSQSLGSGRQSKRLEIQVADSKNESDRPVLIGAIRDARGEGVITQAQFNRLMSRIGKRTLTGQELLDFFDGIRKRRSR